MQCELHLDSIEGRFVCHPRRLNPPVPTRWSDPLLSSTGAYPDRSASGAIAKRRGSAGHRVYLYTSVYVWTNVESNRVA